MKDIILNHLIDRSRQETQRFGLICSVCRTEWLSAPKETADAKESAVLEAERNFGICALCGELACNSCIRSVGALRMCQNCADRIK